MHSTSPHQGRARIPLEAQPHPVLQNLNPREPPELPGLPEQHPEERRQGELHLQGPLQRAAAALHREAQADSRDRWALPTDRSEADHSGQAEAQEGDWG